MSSSLTGLLILCACTAQPEPEAGPNAGPRNAALSKELQRVLKAKGRDYEPRTEHLIAEGRPRYVNRLLLEDSPYLLQHAHNPVDWYPWGPEAFARAKAEQRPIFLSIGYSTCHWCHVMERESFENVEIAAKLNRAFICVKVDRERRPEVDELYMTAVQLQSGRGGWPMSSFLTPEGKPFFGATYFPPDRFSALLDRIEELWHSSREELESDADRLADAVAQITEARGEAQAVGSEAVTKAVDEILRRHDSKLGGFGPAPKFPQETELLLLLQHARRDQDDTERLSASLQAAERSLEAMAHGGIYDQVGGGFHRYSTDDRWLVPHFEKMLYNQALLSRAYLAAFDLTGKAIYPRVARQTLDYALREMTAPAGPFYSATDADSEGVEGEFFVWTPEELRAALSPAEASLAIELFGVSDGGNFEGKNILHLPSPITTVAEARGTTPEALLQQIEGLREKLRLARQRRIAPLRDDKVLTAWNGMMITALAEGAATLGERRYDQAARSAAEYLWQHNRDGGDAQETLWRVNLNGKSSIPGLQEDYAYLSEAYLALYDLTGERLWLERARGLADAMLEHFWDADAGGFFMNAAGGELELMARPKAPRDGAVPSGNSVAARTLARLAHRTGSLSYRDRAKETLAGFASAIAQSPSSFSYMLMAADELHHGEAGEREYGALGKVFVRGQLADHAGRLEVVVEIAPGWHVNAHRPRQPELIPTALTLAVDEVGWQLQTVQYPEPEEVRLGFQAEPLLVYQGTVRLAAVLDRSREGARADGVVRPQLTLQACDEKACLQPESLILELALPPSGRPSGGTAVVD